MRRRGRGRSGSYPLVLEASSGWVPVDPGELWRYRGLVRAFARRDLTLRYRQTALGVAWVVLQPLAAAGILSFVFGRVAEVSSGDFPHFAFAFAGLIGWSLFSASISSMSASLVTHAGMVSRVYFPRLILPISQIGSRVVDVGVTSVIFVVVAVGYDLPIRASALSFPVWLLLLAMLATGVGLVAAALNVSYRDVGYVVPVAMSLLLYLSPVAYPLVAVPDSAATLYRLNPLVGLLEGLRWSLLQPAELDVALSAYSAGVSVAVLLVGLYYFRHHERRFADVI